MGLRSEGNVLGLNLGINKRDYCSPDEFVSVSVSLSVQLQESLQVPSHENNTIDGDGRNGRPNLDSCEISFQDTDVDDQLTTRPTTGETGTGVEVIKLTMKEIEWKEK
ncbi:hypothetical protein POM88_033713 [Heracleum sosnowskyi]|uniref:Uncharacterized protein n=1 Tax=Heracleum sosnowskyi TaxID=360622 RepID=A0AAD8MBC3_9APIA|nr:hypothetical protein POM88_033713 [Heracleum sosnowskyi]